MVQMNKRYRFFLDKLFFFSIKLFLNEPMGINFPLTILPNFEEQNSLKVKRLFLSSFLQDHQKN